MCQIFAAELELQYIQYHLKLHTTFPPRQNIVFNWKFLLSLLVYTCHLGQGGGARGPVAGAVGVEGVPVASGPLQSGDASV